MNPDDKISLHSRKLVALHNRFCLAAAECARVMGLPQCSPELSDRLQRSYCRRMDRAWEISQLLVALRLG